MKKWFLAFAFLLVTSSAYAAALGTEEKVFLGDVVNGTGNTVVSRVFDIKSASVLGYWLDADNGASAGSTARINMVMQGSYDTTSANFATITTVYNSLATTAATLGTIQYPAIRYVRFVAQGYTGNATDTTVDMYLFKQE